MPERPTLEEIEAAIMSAGSIRRAAPLLGVDERTVRRWRGGSEDDPGVTAKRPMRLLAIDIETRPLLSYHWGRWQQNIPSSHTIEDDGVLCWAAKWINEGSETVFRSTWRDGHEAMVRGAWLAMNAADAIVHYNGCRFDTPWLTREFALLDLDLPAPYKEIDLLRTVKKRFRFQSNKLADIAPAFGLEDKEKHEGISLWIKVLAGDHDAEDRMESYNVQDTELVEQLYNKLHKYIINHPSHAAFQGEDICPTCASDDLRPEGTAYLRTGQYPRFKCGGCGRYSRASKRIGATTITDLAS
jgi:DNA polymerase elongation subunit (family B)